MNYLHFYIDNMPKGYKKEWVEKVKQKFNDLQPNKQSDKKPSIISPNDKRSETKYTTRVDRI